MATTCYELFSGLQKNSNQVFRNTKQSITLSNLKKKSIREDAKNGYYQNSKLFSNQWGEKFVELVFSAINPREKVNIVIAMGGAEYLGYYLRAVAEREGLTNIKFIEQYLTTKVVRPWEAMSYDPKTAIFSQPMQTGIGKIPKELTLTDYSMSKKQNRKNEAIITEYIRQHKVFEGVDKVLVVDTGYNGTMVEVINTVAKSIGFNGEVIGALIEHNGPKVVKNNMPILSLNHGKPSQEEGYPKAYSTSWWAYFMDIGYAPGDFSGWSYSHSFQRSRPSPTKLVKEPSGKWVPNTTLYGKNSRNAFNFQSMILGIDDVVFGQE
ncbi:MAG: hypothetical protein HOO06_06355 [Bdellovibrionaceae bacterium]|nr:hypothetical protein [Pseudobdellovibrionaceae bacterium]